MKRSVKEQRERAVKKIKRKRQTAADTTETVSAHYPDRLSEERDYKERKLENVQKQKDTFFEGDEPCARGDQKETASRVSLSSPKTYACPMSSQEGRVRLFLQAFGAPAGIVIDRTAEHTDDAGKKENDHENQRRGNYFQRQSGINAVIFIF